MEPKNRSLRIVVFVVIALALLCCCVFAAASAFLVPRSARSNFPEGLTWPSVHIDLPGREVTERIVQSFGVGSTPTLGIRNFAGSVTLRRGDSDTVRVVATKRARSRGDLDAIAVQMSGQDCCVEITTNHPTLPTISSAWVELEIIAPAGTDVDLRTGAGTVTVRDMQGALQIEAGAGTVDVRGAAGPVSVNTGAGTIDYEGNPAGECGFHAGTGSVTLRVPSDADLTVELSSGLGSVHSDLPVSGTVTRRLVRGTIGTGRGASISASTGVGSVGLTRR